MSIRTDRIEELRSAPHPHSRVVGKCLTPSAFSRYTSGPSVTYRESVGDAIAVPSLDDYAGRTGLGSPDAAAAPSKVLFWSRRGEVACATHAPEPASARWTAEQWTTMPVTAMQRHGLLYQCQHCSASGRPIHHRSNGA